MALHMLGKDPASKEGKSATVYYDDVADRYLIQGLKVLDQERLSKMDLPDHETVVEIPTYMVKFFPEVSGGGGADV
ncbi:hypothetical protein C9F11_18115 [Streptomyces sp. YIM 121038]|uniref:hypothetical protein n=1 Tax=Streptomyces sp. YIM 121038 TaxID=2136401 RepID=UPI0011109CD8|nr:hypothetical protein [Streptomyces sp. YIM 121038]QCX77275.1 hypothetical protein C9F11_18115 [Streptomyces sp. YIM 121038]